MIWSLIHQNVKLYKLLDQKTNTDKPLTTRKNTRKHAKRKILRHHNYEQIRLDNTHPSRTSQTRQTGP